MRKSGIENRLTPFVLLVLAVLVMSCASCSTLRIDPSGERVFIESSAPANYREVPDAPLAWDPVDLTLSPSETIAPVDSEVVLLAGVVGSDSCLRTNERVEWTVASSGVGSIVEFDRGAFIDLMLGDFTQPRKISDAFAITSTSRDNLQLTRGTPTPSDDVGVLAGQTWVSMTSPVEGTSYITAYAPSVYGWDCRKRAAVIHWVDAQWRFPTPTINTAGSKHIFSTVVTRHTNQSPCVGWIVRYEIVGGPPAAFAPAGSTVAEVVTDTNGRADVEIYQREPCQGTNQINVQVVRPANLGGSAGRRFVVGNGSTTATWSSPRLTIRKTGPVSVGVGATLDYQIQVDNVGDLTAKEVIVADEVPDGMEFIECNPIAERVGNGLKWNLGPLAAGEARTLEVKLRALRSGGTTSCAEVTAGPKIKAKDCVTTTVGEARLEVKLLGPTQAKVGENVQFELVVTNRGQGPATGLMIRDTFDDGLKHGVAASPVERDLADLQPGQSHRIGVKFDVVSPGRHCQNIEVTGAGRLRATASLCLTATGAEVTPPPVKEQPAMPPGKVSIRINGPSVGEVGKVAEFTIDVKNLGAEVLTNLKVTGRHDTSLSPTMATEGCKLDPVTRDLMCTIDRLPPSKTVRLVVQYRCMKKATWACNRVMVTDDRGTRSDDSACLRIHKEANTTIPSKETASKLTVSVQDLHDPITVGKGLTYEIRVTNPGIASDGQVLAVVTVPPELSVDRIGTTGPGRTGFQVQGQTIRFEPVPEIQPGETLNYRVRVTADRPSRQVILKVQATSREMLSPVESEEDTEILPRKD